MIVSSLHINPDLSGVLIVDLGNNECIEHKFTSEKMTAWLASSGDGVKTYAEDLLAYFTV